MAFHFIVFSLSIVSGQKPHFVSFFFSSVSCILKSELILSLFIKNSCFLSIN